MPSVRSYDVIGLWYNQSFVKSNYYGYMYYTQSGTTYKTTYSTASNSGNIKIEGSSSNWFGGGIGISMPLPSSTNVTFIQSQLFVEGNVGSNFTVNGSYQHATSNVTLSDSKNYTFAPLGLGNVFAFNTNTLWNTYDQMRGVSIEW